MSFLAHHDAKFGDGSGDREPEDLMVFGYSCKLYRDDAKAMAEDSGVYLIPWMGDHSLMIDRYDCRGHLYDKNQFGLKPNLPRRWTAEEEAFEEMLDHERYMALDKDMREEDFKKEEEERRLFEAMQDGYSAVGFKYNETKGAEATPVMPQLQPPPPPPLSSVIVDRPDDEDTYVLPAGLNLPNGIETPTTNKLHNIIEKTALFISQQGTQMEIRIKINQKNNPYFAFMDFNDRLHPYYKHLLRVITSGNYTPKPQVEQKVEKVEKKDGRQQLEKRVDRVEEEQQDNEEDEEDEDSDGDYELHPLLMGSRAASSNSTSNDKVTGSSSQLTSSANGHSGAMSTQSYLDQYQQQAAYAYYMDQSSLHNSSLGNIMPAIPLNALIEDPPHPPPPDIQPIIDKLAEYIAKHGHAFEDTVKRNGDPRLQFINSSHEYYKYFMLRKNLYRQKFLMEEMANENKPKQVVTQDLPCAVKETTDVQTLKEDGSVGFKIATKEEKVMSGVYLGSASDEEGEGDDGKESSEAAASDTAAAVEHKDTEVDNADSAVKKTSTVITTTSLPKSSVVEEQEKTKSERRKKAAMFVEQLRQKRAEKIAKETDIIGPLLPHEYKYSNRKYEELSPATAERVVSNSDDEDGNDNNDGSDEGSPSAKRMKMVAEEDEDDLLEAEEPAPSTRMRTRLAVKSVPRH